MFCAVHQNRLNDFQSSPSASHSRRLHKHETRDFVEVEVSSGLQALAGGVWDEEENSIIVLITCFVNEDLVDSRAGMLWIPKSSMILDIVLVEDNDIRMGVCL